MIRHARAAIRLAATMGALTFALAGCATGYHSSSNLLLGYTGGYSESKGPGELVKVNFAGNGFIKPETVSAYLVYRCAEVTRRDGHTWFALYRNVPDAIMDRRSAERSVGAIGGKPSGFAYILYFDAEALGLLNADEVMARLKPVVDNGGKVS